MKQHYERIPSPQLGRDVHIWQFGHAGLPILAFPTAGGMAHEWQAHGMVASLSDLLDAGVVRLYCPETNVSEAWTDDEMNPVWRMERHQAYEAWVLEQLLPRIGADTGGAPVTAAGCSLGGFYAANFALKHPWAFKRALCMSGRYRMTTFTAGLDDLSVYYNNPIAYAPNLCGAPLEAVQRQTKLVLVCGQGRFEGRCVDETRELAAICAAKGIPIEQDLWGHDVSHEWTWWRRQLRFHVQRWLHGQAA